MFWQGVACSTGATGVVGECATMLLLCVRLSVAVGEGRL